MTDYILKKLDRIADGLSIGIGVAGGIWVGIHVLKIISEIAQ